MPYALCLLSYALCLTYVSPTPTASLSSLFKRICMHTDPYIFYIYTYIYIYIYIHIYMYIYIHMHTLKYTASCTCPPTSTRHAVCRMPYAVCRMPYALCLMPYASKVRVRRPLLPLQYWLLNTGYPSLCARTLPLIRLNRQYEA